MYEITTTPEIDDLKAVYIKLAEAEKAAINASEESFIIVMAARLAVGKLIAEATHDHLLAERKNV